MLSTALDVQNRSMAVTYVAKAHHAEIVDVGIIECNIDRHIRGPQAPQT
jgi:hypothetical protein